MPDLMKMFAAHSPVPERVPLRFEHCYTENMSIVTLIKAPDNPMPAFEHSHEDYEFIVPHTPIPFLTNEDAVYFGEVGWVFPVQSGRAHGVKYSTPDVSHSDIVINKEYIESIMREKGLAGVEFNYEFPATDEMKLYLRTFKKEYAKGEKRDTHKLKHLAALITVELIDEGAKPEVDTRKPKYGYQKGIRSVAEFVNDNYKRNITVGDMAQMCGLSVHYFSSQFKKAYGDTPQDYLIKLRLSKAKQLLETTAYSISDISEMCGFNKVNSFTTQFKRAVGKTPTEYRRVILEGE